MVRYSEELIDEIKNSNDIVDVISQYVILKRSGRNFFGLCPFHKEKSPSFSVSPDKQIFHCFGCGAGGNVIHFVSKIENADFKEAISILANRAGIELPTLNNYEDNKTAMLKTKVYEINQIAAEFYHHNLYRPTSKTAQEYIKKRKLDNKTLKSFLIGYSGNYDELYKILKQKGYKEEEILASSLVNKTDDGKYIDRFRKRVMFPIQDIRNKVIAFGGRVLDDSKPKYINSPENIVYSKGRHLFGLNVAKKSDLKNIIIVEGYMDAISLYQRGITNVVASLGTALTEAQGRLLRRYSERVTIGYDSDGAGQAATLRGLEILQNIGCDVRILQISGAKDPDEYVIKYGPERFLKCVEQAISLVEFKVKMLKQNLNLENINDKIKFLNEIQYKIAAFAGVITQFAWGGMYIMLYCTFMKNGNANTYTIPQMCTYIWLHQAFFLLFNFVSVDKDILEMCKTGGVALELVKPIDLYYIWHAKTLGKKIAATSLRALPIFIICTMPFLNQYKLTAPVNIGAFFLFVITLILSLGLIIAYVMLLYIIVMKTTTTQGIKLTFQLVMEFCTGGAIPIAFMPKQL